jgi:hypothetical protein
VVPCFRPRPAALSFSPQPGRGALLGLPSTGAGRERDLRGGEGPETHRPPTQPDLLSCAKLCVTFKNSHKIDRELREAVLGI